MPIYFHVSRLRDGGSYVTRLVEAKQKGRCIFVLFSSYARPEPNRPRFAVGLPQTISNNEELTPGEGGFKSPQGSSIIRHVSRFSRERAPDGQLASGLIPYDEAPLNESRYERVLKEMDAYLPEKVKSALAEWVKDRRESAVEIR